MHVQPDLFAVGAGLAHLAAGVDAASCDPSATTVTVPISTYPSTIVYGNAGQPVTSLPAATASSSAGSAGSGSSGSGSSGSSSGSSGSGSSGSGSDSSGSDSDPASTTGAGSGDPTSDSSSDPTSTASSDPAVFTGGAISFRTPEAAFNTLAYLPFMAYLMAML